MSPLPRIRTATATAIVCCLLAAVCACNGSRGVRGPARATGAAATSAQPDALAIFTQLNAAGESSGLSRLPRHAIVAAANPLAARAGLAVLRAGGSAADAAVAVQAVLGLVEPQSSGVGGGAFIVYYDAASRSVRAINGRETAPAGASPDMFLGPDGKALPFYTAVLSGRSTGVPGAIAALALLQQEHGRLPWHTLFDEARALATGGFTVSPRLAGMIAGGAPQAHTADAQRYFTRADGARYEAGNRLRNLAYAETLAQLADQGPAALYRGRLARDIVARVQVGSLPGTLAPEDFAHYRALETPALCRDWQAYVVCVPPPPAGGVSLLQLLELLADTDIADRSPADPIAWSQLAQSERLMYADRDRYVGDPSFVPVPTDGLLDPGYVRARAALMREPVPAAAPQAGEPPGAPRFGTDHTREPGGTSHFVIVDADGNVVSMTTTVESIFGSGRMTDGFFLNNQLTDFSFSPTDAAGAPAANAVAPGKRPRSAMSPVIVLDRQGRFVAAAGSAGGPAIIAYVAKTLIGVLDWHLSMQQAIALPNLVAHGAGFDAEIARFPPPLLQQLGALGLALQPAGYEGSGLQGVIRRPDGVLEGGVDPRREGLAIGY